MRNIPSVTGIGLGTGSAVAACGGSEQGGIPRWHARFPARPFSDYSEVAATLPRDFPFEDGNCAPIALTLSAFDPSELSTHVGGREIKGSGALRSSSTISEPSEPRVLEDFGVVPSTPS